MRDDSMADATTRAHALCALLRDPAATLPTGVTWEQICVCAERHHLGPSLYFHLKSHASPGTIPEAMLAHLQHRYHTVAVFNTRLFHDLAAILRHCAEADIPVMILKGAYLARSIYLHPGLRPMVDIDLLVKRADLERAYAALAELGYGAAGSPDCPEPVDSVQSHLPTLSRPAGTGPEPIPVEVHWTIVRPAARVSLVPEALWLRARSVEIAGVATLVLSPEDLLHHLVLHCAADDLFRPGLLPLLDLATVIDHFADTFDWTAFRSIAAEAGSSKHAFLALFLVAEFFRPATLSAEFLESIRPADCTPEIIDWARNMLLQDNDPAVAQAVTMGTVAGHSGWLHQGCNVVRKIIPPRDELADTYGVSAHAWRIWLFYPIRWCDLWRRYRKTMGQVLGGDKALRAALATGKVGRNLAEWLNTGSPTP
jgi:hypothetical protein